MFAIVETGGKQYKVSEGDIIFVEKLGIEEGETYTFDKVLAIADDNGFVAGNPTVNATVTATVVKNGKGKKLHIIRYKPKKDSKKHIGHRQPYTKLQILSISK
ncbi:MAG: 50S ribosomal protein L21 [Clostridia bacterium]|nr:50S ribosomal protein L21 [Clostridia bacterium]